MGGNCCKSNVKVKASLPPRDSSLVKKKPAQEKKLLDTPRPERHAADSDHGDNPQINAPQTKLPLDQSPSTAETVGKKKQNEADKLKLEAHRFSEQLSQLVEDEATVRATIVVEEAGHLSRLLDDNSTSLEWIAVALANTVDSFREYLKRKATDKTSFDIKLGFVVEDFFGFFFNIYMALSHGVVEPRSFLLSPGICNAAHADFALVKETDVEQMIGSCSPSLQLRWRAPSRTPLITAKILDEIHMRGVWEDRYVDFWEGRAPTRKQQISGKSRVEPLATLPLSDVTMLNSKVSDTPEYASGEQNKYVQKALPVHALAFLRSGGTRTECRKDVELRLITFQQLPHACDGTLPDNVMFLISPSIACAFVENELNKLVKNTG